jgi:hypothetical protein
MGKPFDEDGFSDHSRFGMSKSAVADFLPYAQSLPN